MIHYSILSRKLTDIALNSAFEDCHFYREKNQIEKE